MPNRILELIKRTAKTPETPAGDPESTPEESAAQDVTEAGSGDSAPADPGEEEIARLKNDVALLLELFPKLKADAVPQEVWDRVREGDSLSAAYCLWLVKTVKEKKRIGEVNEKNRAASLPKLDTGSDEGFFTREAVKRMSQEQIRKNLDSILRSMDSWN